VIDGELIQKKQKIWISVRMNRLKNPSDDMQLSGLAICGRKCQNPVDLPSGSPLFCLPTTSPTIPQCWADPLPPLDF